jgi:hypothetical protein
MCSRTAPRWNSRIRKDHLSPPTDGAESDIGIRCYALPADFRALACGETEVT